MSKEPAAMQEARLIRPFKGVTVVDAKTYDKSRDGILMCMDDRCKARLRHVPRNMQNKRETRAYFGRKSNEAHSRVCKFNVSVTVQRIAARSERFEEARDPIAIGPNGTAVLRLNIVFDALRVLDRQPAMDGPEIGEREGVETVVGGKTLPQYLRRARAILALIARLGDTTELRNALRITYGNAVLSWDDFFYGPDEIGRLYDRLQVLHTVRNPFHPVAVVLSPAIIDEITARDAVFNCQSEELNVQSGGELRVTHKLSCRPPSSAEAFMPGQQYLVCGLPRPRRGDMDLRPAPGTTRHVNVYMDVSSRSQFALWSH